MFMPRKADEFGGLANAAGDGARDSSGQHALDSWESEGGGPAEALREPDFSRRALSDNAGWRASNSLGWLASHPGLHAPSRSWPAALEIDDEDEEERILRCLGAAVIMRWNTIPTKLQRELFDDASSMPDLLEAGALKGQIARFLASRQRKAQEHRKAAALRAVAFSTSSRMQECYV
jgi:hypothetical protein